MSVRIAVVGTGYVGLVSGACFSELGHDVICIDNDARKIEAINGGSLPIYEPELEDLVKRNVKAGRLRFSTSIAEGVRGREAVFLAVGTPSANGTGQADLRYVFGAALEVAEALDGFTVIVTKSTVPVGTNQEVYVRLRAKLGGDREFAVASNPEFLREGAAIRDFLEPDRVVLGCRDERAAETMARIYAPLTERGVPLVATDIETAEMIKYAANAFLAVKVSFINEIADLCEATGADVRGVAEGMGLDHRIGAAFLRPGPGWGGSCFPKDTRALLSSAREAGVPARIVEAAVEANDNRKRAMIERIRGLCGGSAAGKRIAVLGLTFKGQTDDMRDSPSLDILPSLVREGALVAAFDPARPPEAERLLPQVEMAETAGAAASGADILVILTDWAVFRTCDLQEIAASMRSPVMLDLRNIFERGEVLGAGFREYHGLGQGEAHMLPIALSTQAGIAKTVPRVGKTPFAAVLSHPS